MRGIFTAALALASSLRASLRARPIQHQDKAADDVFNPDPARPRRAAKKSSGGSHRRIRRDTHYYAWKKAFGGIACPDYEGLRDVRPIPKSEILTPHFS